MNGADRWRRRETFHRGRASMFAVLRLRLRRSRRTTVRVRARAPRHVSYDFRPMLEWLALLLSLLLAALSAMASKEKLSRCHRKHTLPDQIRVRPSSGRNGIALSNTGTRSHWHRPY